jgi:hypothetical protein
MELTPEVDSGNFPADQALATPTAIIFTSFVYIYPNKSKKRTGFIQSFMHYPRYPA